MELDVNQIKAIMPHRYPFLLIDKVTGCVPGEWAEARKCVSANEPYFAGHFPDLAVVPGVLILEAMAQTGMVALLTQSSNRGKIALFGGVRNARFKAQVRPGDVLALRCEIVKRYGKLGVGDALATVDGKLMATAELSFAVAD